MEATGKYRYFDRDLSWLSFNERILMEAARPGVPVGERLSFLGIFASNLDEFYRVRVPAILALKTLPVEKINNLDPPLLATENELLTQVRSVIDGLQNRFGLLMLTEILPDLKLAGVDFKYNAGIPAHPEPRLQAYFFEKVAAYLQMTWLPDLSTPAPVLADPVKQAKLRPRFFPENDQIYLAVFGKLAGDSGMAIIRIPSGECDRFIQLEQEGNRDFSTVWLLDDIIRMHTRQLAGKANFEIEGSYSFKLSRDADIDYKDEYAKDIAGFIQKQIGKRSFGLATRLLYDQNMPGDLLDKLLTVLHCPQAALVKGGRYHNLKDLMNFPIQGHKYTKWPAVEPDFAQYFADQPARDLLDQIAKRDLLISTPYQDYSTVLRFFNEAAISPDVTSVAVTIYRIASDSLIARALMTAAKNGKKVTVFVELKARFDEANNIKWAAKMKAAGVRIVYSIWALKVHAKIALVKRKVDGRLLYSGIVATGNFNEKTATLYGDHILMTSNREMMADIETLMLFLEKRARPAAYQFFQPQKLLIAGFNLQAAFLAEIGRCKAAAQKGTAASITIKLNNLEEQTLIDALYAASNAGVRIRLMIRSICRLLPGVAAMSENIEVYRLVDRYLEHSRVFIFEAGGDSRVFIGSSDWMNRNIYRRIEVCCPVLDPELAGTIRHIVDLQFRDQVHLVKLDADLQNNWILDPEEPTGALPGREAQKETYHYLTELKTSAKVEMDMDSVQLIGGASTRAANEGN